MIQFLFVLLFGVTAIWFGVKVFTTASMMRSALALLFSMAALGALFMAVQAEFLGVLQLMMMATEMSIMALFMIMYMMSPGGLTPMDMTHQRRFSLAAGVVTALLVASLAAFQFREPSTVAVVPEPDAQLRGLGGELLERSMLVFQTAGVTILVAMIATTAVAIRRQE